MTFEELESKAKEESASSSSNDSSNEREEYPYVNSVPKVGLTFSSIERLVYMDHPTTMEGEPQENTGDYGVVLNNPGVVKGEIYQNNHRPEDGLARDVDQKRGHSKDYAVVDPDDPNFDVSYDADGNPKDVKAGRMDAFESTKVDEFEEDQILVFFGGLAGRRLARLLDVNGGPGAKVDDDGHTNGLIEFTPDGVNEGDKEDNWRGARYPVLRDIDWTRGEGGGFIYHTFLSDILPDYDGNGHGVIVGHNDFGEDETVADATQIDMAFDRNGVDYTEYELLWHDTTGHTYDESDDSDDESTSNDYGPAGSDDTESASGLSEGVQQWADGFISDVGLEDDETVEDVYEGVEGLADTLEENGHDGDEAEATAQYINENA